MFRQSLFGGTADTLAMFLGFDSHLVASLSPCLFLTLPPPHLPPPSATVNYCLASKAKTCSECLQTGIGCAYCPDEVRVQKFKQFTSGGFSSVSPTHKG